uniref:Uncharacterized protein n=1 Tax=Aegilops tauschii TaxID=37682 RepID=M8C3R9_AEGTA
MTTTQEEEHDMAGGKSSSISKPQIENAASQEEKDSHEEEIEELWEEMEETMSESEVSDSDEDEDHVEGGESGSTISKRQISKLCEDMEVTLSYLRRDIEPAAPLRETAEDDADEALPPTIHAILEQFKDLRRHMSKLRLQLQPFKERHDEKWAKEDSYEGLDDEEKVRKKIDKEEMFFDIYRRSTESSCRRVVFEQQSNHSSRNTRRRWPGSASAPSGAGHGPASKCVCAPATHVGSFKCRVHHTNSQGQGSRPSSPPSPAAANAVPCHPASPSSSSGTVATH